MNAYTRTMIVILLFALLFTACSKSKEYDAAREAALKWYATHSPVYLATSGPEVKL